MYSLIFASLFLPAQQPAALKYRYLQVRNKILWRLLGKDLLCIRWQSLFCISIIICVFASLYHRVYFFLPSFIFPPMNNYLTYSILGKILALDIIPTHRNQIIRELEKDDISWERFVAMADHHLVLQALYPKIRDHNLEEYFPEELLEHLEYIFDLATTRNIEIIKQVERLTHVLLKEGIIPLYMKGVGNILDSLYKYHGERILHDIDILVSEDTFEEAAEVLIRDGYQSNFEYDPLKKTLIKHYPFLFKHGEPVYVELHRMPVGSRYEKFFNTGMAFAFAKHPVDGPDYFVMSDEHKIIHNFMHAQVDHRARIYAREFMRNLYDMLLLSGRKDIEDVMADFGHFKRTSSGYQDITYLTFGIIPAQRKIPGLFLHSYRFRYYLNLRYRFVGVASLFLIRVFLGYIVKPLQASTDRELRRKIISQLHSPEWYKKQGRYYGKVFGIGGKKKN